MPMLYSDGDAIEIHILQSYGASEIIVSDVGLSMARLESEGMQPRKQRLSRLMAGLGVELGPNDELFVKTTSDGLGLACLRLSQAISNMSAVSYMRRATTVDDFNQEFGEFLKSHKIQAKRDVRRNVSFETRHGLTVQAPSIDFQLSNEVLVMTVPASPAARGRKIDHCYRAWDVLERAKDSLPRITVVDSELPISREDANLLGDYSAVIPFSRLETNDFLPDDLQRLAAERTILSVA